jgi:hypothetical protein
MRRRTSRRKLCGSKEGLPPPWSINGLVAAVSTITSWIAVGSPPFAALMRDAPNSGRSYSTARARIRMSNEMRMSARFNGASDFGRPSKIRPIVRRGKSERSRFDIPAFAAERVVTSGVDILQ